MAGPEDWRLSLWWQLPPYLGAIIVSAALFFPVAVIYRLYLHPLSHVPGPKLAAITPLYEFYHDACRGGKYYWRIQEMHQEHGPVVRISPNAVHVNDPEFFDELYNVVGRLDKDPKFYRMLGLPQSTFQTTTHALHRVRRKPISKFFASTAVPTIEGIVNSNLERLCARLEHYRQSGQPVSLSDAFRCFTTDAISEYVLPHGYNLLGREEFAASYNQQLRDLGIVSLWNRTFPFLLPLSMMTPRWIVKHFAPPGALETFDVQMGIAKQARSIATSSERSDRTVIHGLMNSDLPHEEKMPPRVVQDAWALVLAGTETTAVTLEKMVFYLLNNRDLWQTLKNEIDTFTAQGGNLQSTTALRRLPYLNAVVSEGQRLAIAVSGRLPRIDRNITYVCKGIQIPHGTSISMSIAAMHYNPDIYPDPARFDPERFLRPAEKAHSEAYLVPFGKGSRMCLGKEFAITTMYLALTQILVRFDLELFETTLKDIEMAHEMFAPLPAADAKGVRVVVQ